MGEHLEDSIGGIQDLTVENMEIPHEDVHDLAEWCNVEEGVDRGLEDSSESHSMHVLTN